MEQPGSKAPKWKIRQQWTRLVCVIVVVAVALLISTIVLGVLLATRGDQNVCFSRECIKNAATILDNMDDSVDPCDDFYEFACGGFLKRITIPEDKSAVTMFSLVNDQLMDQLGTILNQQSDNHIFNMAKKMFRLCSNTTLIEEKGLEPLKKITRKVGGWPVLEGYSWDHSQFTWMDTMVKMIDSGMPTRYFMTLSATVDSKNSSRNIIELDDASLGLNRESLVEGMSNRLVQAYYAYMVDVAVMMGARREFALAELKESLTFEMKLANITLPPEQRRNWTLLYNPMTVRELSDKIPSVPWKEFLNHFSSGYIHIEDDEVINVSHPDFVVEFEKLIEATPKRVQANYAVWRVIMYAAVFMTHEFRERQLAYTTALTGKTLNENRNRECISLVTNWFGTAIGAEYVGKYFHPSAKKDALELVDDIRSAFDDALKGADWIDDNTKAAALEKSKSIKAFIAYPDELLDDEKIKQYYEGYELDTDIYLDAGLKMNTHRRIRGLKEFRIPNNKTDWRNHAQPAVLNAFYAPNENSIEFPAGILQGLYFSKGRPKYLNYGAIGFVIGHEITHGFDDQGRQYDKNGNVVDWWESDTTERYLQKAKCIVEQYSNFSAPEVGINLNGINTQGENIADNGGMKIAYQAYSKWAANMETEPSLPGLKYTPKQLFWLSAANTWCSKYRPEVLKITILEGYHSPGRFRVNGPLANLDEFSEDFGCPAGSRMNPPDKCKIW